ncbi:diacylglycerol kinase [Alloscardovia theropitheci]|uniref:Diacylglycerol kinase n=1 Tax=Alloscardovia theropitheci TaxID=2496842 RepID=A0A4R0R0N8_9BIFI|nr:diacylglycerol kinase family protein [Alloscardovia theropitheci]TCD54626.1 diacylglycerol kinase [Alloscardovia theropitheci]
MNISWGAIAIAVTIIVVAVFVVVGIIVHVRQGRRQQEIHVADQRTSDKHITYAFIINPSKPEAPQAREFIEKFCASHGITDTLFIETRLDYDGRACAEEALAKGADVVIAVGGDGTVRTVASAMAYSTHAFAIIPIGTGNLFARNIGIPVGNIEAALSIATSHGSRRVDMGRMNLLDSAEPDHEHGFLVIAGAGFDAYMINDTDPTLKANISWFAYFVAAFKHLFGQKSRGTIIIRTAAGVDHSVDNVQFRTIMAGNCGNIPGFSLMPDAVFDDGLLDIETIDTRSGLIGWVSLFWDVVHKTVTRSSKQSPFATHATVRQYQGVSAEIILEKTVLAEVDGDILGKSDHFLFSIDRKALLVRAPHLAASGDATGSLPPIN